MKTTPTVQATLPQTVLPNARAESDHEVITLDSDEEPSAEKEDVDSSAAFLNFFSDGVSGYSKMYDPRYRPEERPQLFAADLAEVVGYFCFS
ncbi:unnamed protein product [Gongylonema pulchrum]|uniref:Uncharacterized protein n=1 Tax=Gongylonema pulchrum TaxID=637853 RepID=A0A183EMQ0_9BILA|nr:unnamed protein product [Gongylonema pulchrum]